MVNKRLVRLVKGSMRAVWQNVAVQWLGLCLNMVTIGAIAWLLSRLLGGGADVRAMVFTAVIVAACTALRFGCSMLSGRLGFLASDKVKYTLRRQIYTKLLAFGPSYHEQVATSEVVQLAVEGVDQLEIYFGKYLPQLFYSLLAPLTLFLALSFVNLPSALALLVCVPLIPVSIVAVQRFAKRLLAKYWGKYTSLGDGFLENLQGLTTLKIYGGDQAKHEEMNGRAEAFRKVTMKVLVMQLNSVTLMDLIAYGGAALGIIVAVTQCASGAIGFAGCFLILMLAADFFLPLRLLGSFFHIAMNGMAAAGKIFKLLDLPVRDQGEVADLDGDGSVELNHVGFSYDGERTVLKDICLRAGTGITAIVGESGCGKSTIAALMTGQNKGYQGRVAVSGVEAARVQPQALSKMVTLVAHNSYLFKGTVRSNLLMGDPDAGEDAMWMALARVGLDAFLRGEQGLDTALAEQASNLSGGQRQRLALARAILHDTPVYVFDEATSNIDVESENDIAAVIWEMGKTKTVVMISHRLANVVPASCIYMMERGRIAEFGRHEQLLAQNGAYARLYRAQQALEGAGRKEAAHA